MLITSPKSTSFALGLFLLVGTIDLWLRAHGSFFREAACNPGIGMGIRLAEPLLWIGIGVFLSLTAFQWKRAEKVIERIGWTALFVGGTVNAVDRLSRGCVLDYIHSAFFPSFNLADMMLSLGALMVFGAYTGIFPKIKAYVS